VNDEGGQVQVLLLLPNCFDDCREEDVLGTADRVGLDAGQYQEGRHEPLDFVADHFQVIEVGLREAA
jgi:hypothetical protein